MIKKETEAIIFDLGGVILNIDYHLTQQAFIDLGIPNFEEMYSKLQQSDLFDRFETGDISSFHFINRLLDHLPQGMSGNKVVHAWNAMVLDFPVERLEWLLEMKKRYRIFLLSNTNTLHMEVVRRALEKAVGHKDLEHYFEHVYLSCDMGLRKPTPEIFKRVCREQNLDPATTVFIDDSPQHVEGAASVGLQAIHLKPGQTVQSLFS